MIQLERYSSFEKWFCCLLNFFEVCGFHHSAWGQHRITKYAIIAIQILLMYLFTVNETRYILALTEFTEKLGLLNFSFFYSAALVSYWIIMIESYTQQSAQKMFWEIFGQLDDTSCERNSLKQLYLFKYAIHLILFIFMLLVSSQDMNTSATAIMTYYVLLFMCNNWLFYFLFYLTLIRNELEQIRSYSLYYRSFDCKNVLCDIRIKSRNHYQRVFEMTECMNRFCGWSQYATILLSFYTLLTYINFVYQQIDRKFEGHGSKMCNYDFCCYFSNEVLHFLVDFFLLLTLVRILYTGMMILFLLHEANRCSELVNGVVRFFFCCAI